LDRATAHYHKREDDKAIADAGAALRIKPDMEGAYYLRANAYRRSRQFAKALDTYDTYLSQPEEGMEGVASSLYLLRLYGAGARPATLVSRQAM
jgi:tetratricopeptide (TPR) repeat protein